MTDVRRYVVVRGKSTAFRFLLPKLGSLSVGEALHNDIRVVEPGVEPEHATIFLDHGIGVRILSGSGALVPADKKRSKERPLEPGATVDVDIDDTVRVGQAELVFMTTEEVETSEHRMRRPDARIYASSDPEMLKVLKLVDKVAPSNTCVLITGETGVGKDLVAQLIHDRSPRAQKPFLRVSCIDLSDGFAEDSGANLLARAKGGTLHLDEVGGLSPRAQLGLGHLLEEAPGSGYDVRFVASTNQDLSALVGKGSFRKDLLFRLTQLKIHVPALRERAADIVPLAEIFVDELAQAMARKTPPKITDEAAEALSAYAWPGNVRELRNVIERAMLLQTGDTLLIESLGTEETVAPEEPAGGIEKEESQERKPMSLREEIGQLEKRRILEALRRYPTQRDAAIALDMPMRTFLNRLDALGIPRARGGGSGNKDS